MIPAGPDGAAPKIRRVVTKLTPSLYTRLYAVKLRTGKSLQELVTEAVHLLIAKYKIAHDTSRALQSAQPEPRDP